MAKNGKDKSASALLPADKAGAQLATMTNIHDVREVRDKAEAVVAYCKARGRKHREQNAAAHVKILAECRLGELLAEMDRAKPGDNLRQGPKSHDVTTGPTLTTLGIGKMQSSRWQQMAKVSAEVRNAHIEHILASPNAELTSKGVWRLGAPGIVPDGIEDHGTYPTTDLQALIDQDRTFGTVYADPPWQYGNQGTRSATDTQYPTMKLDDICALPVGDLAAQRSHLHLWTTNAFLFDARKVLEAWGFEYKSCFVWVKPQLGIGNYWRVSHEFILLGVRGGLTFSDKGQTSWMQHDRLKHSQKPYAIRNLVEKVSPAPRIELFGRTLVEGWTVWGNEVDGNVLKFTGVA